MADTDLSVDRSNKRKRRGEYWRVRGGGGKQVTVIFEIRGVDIVLI